MRTCKSLIVMAAAVLLLPSAHALTTIGDFPCAQWLAGKGRQPEAAIHSAWLLGYLSGLAEADGHDVLKDQSQGEIEAAMTTRCEASPERKLSLVATALFGKMHSHFGHQ